MRLIAYFCGALALSACAHNEDIITRNSDLPGIQTTINCSPEPTLIYSKTGQLIETVVPVLHPSCEKASSTNAAGPVPDSDKTTGVLTAARAPAGFFFFGPATYAYKSPLEATDDDAVPTSTIQTAAAPTTTTPTPTTGPSTPTTVTPTVVTTGPTTPTGGTPTTALSKLDQLKQHAGVPF